MSRGERTPTTGNLSNAMRDNYAAHGVDEYYRKVGTSYRNPHFPGVKTCVFLWLNMWWEHERESGINLDELLVFDMACGSGEVTLSVLDWWRIGQQRFIAKENAQQKRPQMSLPPPLDHAFPRPRIIAADPFTGAAYKDRVGTVCASCSFRDISEGALSESSTLELGADDFLAYHDSMVICSFALHLVESPSELFSLLWELSTKFRWLVILAPHKKPEVKEGWGWTKWDVSDWKACGMQDSKGEILQDRVHCRVYRSATL